MPRETKQLEGDVDDESLTTQMRCESSASTIAEEVTMKMPVTTESERDLRSVELIVRTTWVEQKIASRVSAAIEEGLRRT